MLTTFLEELDTQLFNAQKICPQGDPTILLLDTCATGDVICEPMLSRRRF